MNSVEGLGSCNYVLNTDDDKSITSGKSRDDMIPPLTESELGNFNFPNLVPPKSACTLADVKAVGTEVAALPSFGASVMGSITELNADQRRINKDMKAENSKLIVETMEDQAEVMNQKAIDQFALSITSSVVSIAQGFGSVGVGMKMTDQGSMTSASNAISGIGGGIAGMLSAGATFAGGLGDAKVKAMDAEIEELRGNSEAGDSINEALKDVIQKTIATQEKIQEGENETRKKILG